MKVTNEVLHCSQCGKELLGVTQDYNVKMSCKECLVKNILEDSFYSVQGDKVIFCYINNGTNLDQEYAKKFLVPNGTYTVKHIHIQGWSTEIELEEFPTKTFNSVFFKRIP